MEVEITWSRVVRVWWAYAWRNIVVAIAVGILGFVLGFIMGAIGFTSSTTTPLGVVIGFGLSVIPMKMILGKDFGQFRLILVSKD